ncbi:hypothetical protein HGB07_03215 [Candidatus Roizmanbacteria bacterium]|nr:hypothetical protein [Candidatus Roizmanbacteria bacterium]
MTHTKTTDLKTSLSQLESTLELYLVKKAPAIPAKAKETIVNIAPWITLIIIILTAPALLAIFGLGALVAPFAFLGGAASGLGYLASLILSAIMLVMEAMAIPGLMHRKRSAWDLVYCANLLGVIQNVVNFNLGALVIGSLLSMYILFQVKSYYK